tara:strand:+ start:1460 stop:1648 length:189 start_codon:yes stop_codon:yes gene_type:complete
MIKKFNIWYDNLKEPWRFFGMCLMCWPPLLLLTMCEAFEFKAIGAAIICGLVLMRMHHIHGK